MLLPDEWGWNPSNITGISEALAALDVRSGIQQCLQPEQLQGNTPDFNTTYWASENTTWAPATPAPTELDETCRESASQPFEVGSSYPPEYLLPVAASAFFVWAMGWSFLMSYTSDAGHIQHRKRRFESHHRFQRMLHCLMVYAIELPQYMALAFPPGHMSGNFSSGMESAGSLLRAWLGSTGLSGEAGQTQAVWAAIAISWALIAVVFTPVCLMVCAPRKGSALLTYLSGRERAGFASEWVRDCMLYFFSLPIMHTLFSAVKCTPYIEERLRSGANREDICYGSEHRAVAFPAVFTLIVFYACCIACGVLPGMVDKVSDMVIHGRFSSMQIQWKFFFASASALLGDASPDGAIALCLAGLAILSLATKSTRPCLVEKINFARNTSVLFGIWAALCSLSSSAMDDATAHSPLNMLVGGSVLLTAVAAIRYYLLPETKSVAPMSCEGGLYEGDVSLGTLLRHGRGTQTWKDGAEYTGTWLLGSIAGQGILALPNGMFYNGAWWAGRRHGYGRTTITRDNDVEMFEGLFHQDVAHGFGKTHFSDGESFEGEYASGKEDGRGKWTFSDGSAIFATWDAGSVQLPMEKHLPQEGETFDGPTRFGVPHGWGTRTRPSSGETYTGMFAAGLRHGSGRETDTVSIQGGSADPHPESPGHPAGATHTTTYDGAWQNDVYHGFGRLSREIPPSQNQNPQGGDSPPPGGYTASPSRAAPGAVETYEGDWHGGLREGFGILKGACGLTYEGHFASNAFHGYGHLQLPRDGVSYTGGFRGGLFHGKGQISYRNGDTYEGSFVQGSRHGPLGRYTTRGGSAYEGEWHAGRPDGSGVMSLAGVGRFTGAYAKGVRSGPGSFCWLDGSSLCGVWEGGVLNNGTLTLRNPLKVSELLRCTADIELTPQMEPCLSGDHQDEDRQQQQQPLEVNESAPIAGLSCGGQYVGDFEGGLMHGSGRFISCDGSCYVGEWRGGCMTGRGRLSFASGECYEGQVVHGRRHGLGENTQPDGRVFTGQWFEGMRHGAGRVRQAGGDESCGFYHRDVYAGPALQDFEACAAEWCGCSAAEVPPLPRTETCTLPSTAPDLDMDWEAEFAFLQLRGPSGV